MNKKWLILLLVTVGCNGSLSDEQRKRLKDNMELNKVKKISEAQITDEAYREGRIIAGLLEKRDPALTNAQLIDSLENVFQAEIIDMQFGDSALRPKELQIIEAYASGSDASTLTDNIQRLGEDSLLYTKPRITQNMGGQLEFSGALGVRMLKKHVILSIKE